MTPAGIGIRNNDGSISFVIISDNGWIKDGIGDILNRDYQNEQAVRDLIENCSLPEGYDLLYNIKHSEQKKNICSCVIALCVRVVISFIRMFGKTTNGIFAG